MFYYLTTIVVSTRNRWRASGKERLRSYESGLWKAKPTSTTFYRMRNEFVVSRTFATSRSGSDCVWKTLCSQYTNAYSLATAERYPNAYLFSLESHALRRKRQYNHYHKTRMILTLIVTDTTNRSRTYNSIIIQPVNITDYCTYIVYLIVHIQCLR